jgi:hypothetical protein
MVQRIIVLSSSVWSNATRPFKTSGNYEVIDTVQHLQRLCVFSCTAVRTSNVLALTMLSCHLFMLIKSVKTHFFWKYCLLKVQKLLQLCKFCPKYVCPDLLSAQQLFEFFCQELQMTSGCCVLCRWFCCDFTHVSGFLLLPVGFINTVF